MLQQTTVSTVLGHYDRFLKRFPDIESLAKASNEEMLIQWKGLGYYRRARNLLSASDVVANEYNGSIPLDYEALIKIKGIGEYTANALLAIGGNKPALALDANLQRVLSRLFGLNSDLGPKLIKEIHQKFERDELFPRKKIKDWRGVNEALMDLGRVYCRSRKAECHLCPLKKNCIAFQNNEVELYPQKKMTKSSQHELELLRVVIRKGNKVLVYKKPESKWLSGQYEVPTFRVNNLDHDFSQYPKFKKRLGKKNLKHFKTGITKYKIENYILERDLEFINSLWPKEEGKLIWKDLKKEENFSTSTLKVFKQL